MPMPAFDTHKAVKALCRAGFDDTQAEAIVEQINGAVNDNVATKTDLTPPATKEELKGAFEKLATKEDMEETFEKFALHLEAALEKQTTRYLKIFAAAGAVIVALTKALDLLLG